MTALNKAALWITGSAQLLVFDLLGRALVGSFSLPIPGPVLGMLLMLLALMVYGRVPRGLALVGEQILRLLVLIFLPATVGIYFLRDLSSGDWRALIAAMVIGTLVSLALTALLLARLIRRSAGSEAPSRERNER